MGGECGTYGRQERYINRVFVGDLREGDHCEDLGVDGDNIKMDPQEVGWSIKWDSSGSGYKQVAGSCERVNEPSSSIKCKEFFD
jgi:hypothetical protein